MTLHSWCSQRLEFFYIINYYFKYLELLDTVFLVLKKKPLGPSLFRPFCRSRVKSTDHTRALVGLQHFCMYTIMLSLLSCALPS